MRRSDNVFHLAIPVRDLDSTQEFYRELGCRIARRYPDRVTVDFFGDQVVCHLAPDKTDSEPDMYPRHFGLTLRLQEDFSAIVERAKSKGLEFFCPVNVRFAGLREEHLFFFLKDPSNNLLEFKYYKDPEMMY